MIRVDGNHKIGMGHFFRSLNLAKELQKNNHKVVFLTQTSIIKKLLPKNFKCVILPSNQKTMKKTIKNLKADVLIIDKHEEKKYLINMFQNAYKKIIAIDYTGKNQELIKFGINILYPKTGIKNRYSFSGFEYSILNNSFTNTRPIDIKRDVKNITIIQGGSDTRCFIPQIIAALNYLDQEITIVVILGPSFNCWKELKSVLKSNRKKIRILHNIKNMSTVLSKSDLVITGGGMTLLETCSLGIPCVIICGENFENQTAKIMHKKGFGINLGFHSRLPLQRIALSTEQLLEDHLLRKKMNRLGPRIIDGYGKKRIVKIIERISEQK